MQSLNATPLWCDVIVLSESSFSDDKKSSAGEVCREKSVQEKCTNIAPIFLRVKQGWDADTIKKAALPRCADVSLPRGQTPARAAFNSLRRRARPRLQQEDVSQQRVARKRKRMNEMSPGFPKRPRPRPSAAGAVCAGRRHLSEKDFPDGPSPPVEKQPRGSRLSRSHRLKVRGDLSAGPAFTSEATGTNDSEPDEPTSKIPDSFEQVFNVEDRLWTDKYSPRHSSGVIGHSAPLTRLHSWLKRWKRRADRDSRRRAEEKEEENSKDSWDCGDFEGEAGSEDDQEEPLFQAMLITGPPGVGKTASVYACAQEFGFKVFEVNCASQRSGRHVLSQLKEATQSHLVETSGKDPLKPAYISHYGTSRTNKSELLPGKPAVLKSATYSSRKTVPRNLRCSARNVTTRPATVNLADFFKAKAKADRCHFGGLLPPAKTDKRTPDASSLGPDQTPPQSRKTATSLILFEEVDVVFDDDVGFLAAIKAFMTTTKRPVVLTTNDPSFRKRFDCSLEEIIYKRPSAASACSHLQRVCLAEEVCVDVEDIRCLLTLSSGDVRRCLLQLQLWGKSRGRSQNVNHSERGVSSDSQLLSSCSAFMLGLHSASLQFLLNHLKCPSWRETEINQLLRLLTESWKRGVPLLYSNLELLLDAVMFIGQPSVPSDAVKVIQRNQILGQNASMQRVKNISKLSRRKNTLTAFDTSSLPNLTHKHPRASFNETCSRVGADRTAPDDETDCLGGLADFFDLMSWLDASLPAVGRRVAGPCSSETFVWTGAELKDSLLDDMREEEGNWSEERLLLDLQATVEGLGCRRCWRQTGQGCRQRPDDQSWRRLAVNGPSTNNNLSFNVQPLCAPSMSQRRYKLSRTVLSSKYFSLQGNREAVSVDYVPLLRFVCRRAARKQSKETVRNPIYLSWKDLGLSKSTMHRLAEDF